MTCSICKYKKNQSDIDPICPFFNEQSEFGENWNCGLINQIREICYEGQQEMPYGVDYRFCDDMKYATIWIDGITEDGSDRYIGMALWIAWYKNRGGTDVIWILDSRGEPKKNQLSRNYKQ